jgi:hypothetical protein
MARTTPTLPSQASATAVAAVAKVPPLHPEYDHGLAGGTVSPTPMSRVATPALPKLPDITAHYPLS